MADLRDKLNKNNKKQKPKFGPGMGVIGQTSSEPLAETPKPVPERYNKPSAEEKPEQQTPEAQGIAVPEVPETITGGTDLASMYKKFQEDNKAAFGKLQSSEQEFLQRKQDMLQEKIQEAQKLKDKELTRNQWLELANVLGQAFAQIGAAQAGMRSGTDGRIQTSFNPQQWSQNYDRVIQRYNDSLREARRTTEEEAAPEAGARKISRNEFDQDLRTRWAIMQDRVQDSRAKAKSLAKDKLPQERDKVKARYAEIRSEIFKMDEGDQDKSKTIANINKKLRGLVTPEHLNQISEERGGRSGWDFWLIDRPDQFSNYIDKLEQAELQALGGGEESSGPKPGTVQSGYRFKGGDPADKANWEKVN